MTHEIIVRLDSDTLEATKDAVEMMRFDQFLNQNHRMFRFLRDAIRDYQPPVEPLRAGDVTALGAEILYVDSKSAFVSRQDGYREIWLSDERGEICVNRGGKSVWAPWPTEDES